MLPRDLILERIGESIHVLLDVRNEGAGRSRGCRAELIRCEKQEPIGWLRVELEPVPEARDPNGSKAGIPPHDSARIQLDHVLPGEPGSYRLEIAVINGEERRSSYVIEVEAVGSGVSG